MTTTRSEPAATVPSPRLSPGGRVHEWGALTREEIAEARDLGAFVVLPIGSVEQHGDHLPVDTDLFLVQRVALAAAERCREAFALVLPGMPFGVAPEHAAWAGTISLSASTLGALLADVAESLRRTGFSRLLVVNGHGGNEAALQAACLGVPGLAAVNYWSPGQAEWSRVNPGAKPTMGHACAYETSLMLATRSGERIAARIDGLPARLVRPEAMNFPAGDCGYYGDPAAATAEAGAMMFERTVAGLARFYAEFGVSDPHAGPLPEGEGEDAAAG